MAVIQSYLWEGEISWSSFAPPAKKKEGTVACMEMSLFAVSCPRVVCPKLYVDKKYMYFCGWSWKLECPVKQYSYWLIAIIVSRGAFIFTVTWFHPVQIVCIMEHCHRMCHRFIIYWHRCPRLIQLTKVRISHRDNALQASPYSR